MYFKHKLGILYSTYSFKPSSKGFLATKLFLISTFSSSFMGILWWLRFEPKNFIGEKYFSAIYWELSQSVKVERNNVIRKFQDNKQKEFNEQISVVHFFFFFNTIYTHL